jgi:hypothetical protein
VRATQDSAFARRRRRRRVVVEAKREAGYTPARALAELDAARRNRHAGVGIFVHPRMPERLDEEELADWRAGRNAVYQLAALTVGARLAVADA